MGSPERQRNNPEGNKKLTRRQFIIGGAALVGSAFAANKVAEYSKKQGEEAGEEAINKLIGGPKKEIVVGEGDTIWGFYESSGYGDVLPQQYIEAVYRLNSKINRENGIIQQNMTLIVPFKAESDQKSE